MPINIGMVSLGCSKNLVDSERMLYKIRERGYKLVTDPAKANVVVINTCGFIQSANEEAIETILELAKLKEEGTIKKIVVTGCLAQRYKEEMAEEFKDEIDAVVGIGNNEDIIDIIDRVLANERVVEFKDKLSLKLTVIYFNIACGNNKYRSVIHLKRHTFCNMTGFATKCLCG